MKSITIAKDGAEFIPSKKMSGFMVRTLEKHSLIFFKEKQIRPESAEEYIALRPTRGNTSWLLNQEDILSEPIGPATGALIIAHLKKASADDVEVVVQGISPEELAIEWAKATARPVSPAGLEKALKIVSRFYHRSLTKEELDTLSRAQSALDKCEESGELIINVRVFSTAQSILERLLEEEGDRIPGDNILNICAETINSALLMFLSKSIEKDTTYGLLFRQGSALIEERANFYQEEFLS